MNKGIARINYTLFLFMIQYSLFISSSFAQCNNNLWHYVYHPNRFIVRDSCITVEGTIIHKKKEADGDFHIRLKLERNESRYLNEKNYEMQDSCLVLEIICARKVKQRDAIVPCRGCPKDVYVPRKGEHVKVTGSFVTDTEHGWNEIHPASSIEIVQ